MCMTVYKLRLYGTSGKIVAVHRLSAATDKEALSIVRGMFNEARAAVVTFDLWQEERCVETAALTRRRGKEKPRR